MWAAATIPQRRQSEPSRWVSGQRTRPLRDISTVNSVKNSLTGYGPRPALSRARRPLSPSRSDVLETLRAQIEPTTVAALVRLSGLHSNTVREHLTALVSQGLARRHPMDVTGRGRPAWLYEATGPDAATSPEYAGLASALASAIHRTTSDPWDPAVQAGEEWGHNLARSRSSTSSADPAAARRAVIGLLDEMGFAPEAAERDHIVKLTRCPLLEAAHRYPDAVCGVHLGLARGALREHGADPGGTELIPFAEPGSCLLRLMGSPSPAP